MTGKKESAQPGAPQTKYGGTVSGNGNTVNIAFEGHEGRVLIENGEPHFVAKDVAQWLGYPASSIQALPMLMKKVPDDWKGLNRIKTPGGIQELLTLTEQGFYFFVVRSDKPKALPLQKWVAGEVLPSIRRTGIYIDPKLRKGLNSVIFNSIFEEMMRPDAQMIRRAERRGARMGVDAYVSLEKGARGFNPDIYGRLVRYYQMGLSYREMSLLLKASQSTLRRWVGKMVLVGMLSPRVKGREVAK